MMNLFTASVFDLEIDQIGAATFGHCDVFLNTTFPAIHDIHGGISLLCPSISNLSYFLHYCSEIFPLIVAVVFSKRELSVCDDSGRSGSPTVYD